MEKKEGTRELGNSHSHLSSGALVRAVVPPRKLGGIEVPRDS
jgi:hypothetical protein